MTTTQIINPSLAYFFEVWSAPYQGYVFSVFALAAVLLPLWDVMSTNMVLKLSGGYEANPIMAWVQKNLGKNWVYARIALGLLPVVLFAFTYPLSHWGSIGGLLITNISLGLVIRNNYKIAWNPAYKN